MKDFFKKMELRLFLDSSREDLKSEIDRLTDEEVLSCDTSEWVDYLESKYLISPITIFEDNIEAKQTKIQIPTLSQFDRGRGAEYFNVEGIRVIFTIPFVGNEKLFDLRPSTYICSVFSVDSLSPASGDACGTFSMHIDFKQDEIINKGEEASKYVFSQFEGKFSSYQKMIGYVNKDISSYNENLRRIIEQLLNKRRDRASKYETASKMLQIPLYQSDRAPNTKPIVLHPVIREVTKRPIPMGLKKEYYISDTDYENINNIIFLCGTTMEQTARTYIQNNEEELRDHLLAALNTHYKNVTGETFRKIGKTDICIQFDNKAAYIGECKIWHGEKLFGDAIQQVMNYSTWRDTKISVIIFNKDNRGFSTILTKIDTFLKSNATNVKRMEQNYWRYLCYDSSSGENITVSVLAFDLYVDKSKIRDQRF